MNQGNPNGLPFFGKKQFTMKKNIWMIIAILFIGYSAGIVTGVVVDVDTVYHTTVKKLKQKNSPDGTFVVDVDTTIEPEKSKREIRKEERQKDREIRKAEKRMERKRGG